MCKTADIYNLSGDSVGEMAQFYKIPPENIIVINDDISLDVGRIRVRPKGSAGGHNGLKSIIYRLNSDTFPKSKNGCRCTRNTKIMIWQTLYSADLQRKKFL